jgi:hypothetical protein
MDITRIKLLHVFGLFYNREHDPRHTQFTYYSVYYRPVYRPTAEGACLLVLIISIRKCNGHHPGPSLYLFLGLRLIGVSELR